MAIRNIVKQGDSCLEKVCRPVTEFNARLHMLLDDMRETLAAADGAGLAAPQVGVLRRAAIIVDGEGGYLELINPEILDQQGSQEGAEGCLSVPGRYGIVERPQKITIKFQDRTGAERQLELEDFLARAACHETDHLEGKLYLRLVTRFLEPEEVEA
ncbi:MAG: peptide deformylase [Clostridiaceae bacterium]|jgi:peptide deformylase|nr:peptide deformylase [Clostridiaceae bacterium]